MGSNIQHATLTILVYLKVSKTVNLKTSDKTKNDNYLR